jgi:anti-sigma regulatory factor (Ser/Thr protein kinase)
MVMNIGGSITRVLVIDDETQVGRARRSSQQLAVETGFDETDAGRVALLATELASNIHKHAKRGQLHLRMVPGRQVNGIEIIAVDKGPGFDIDACLADGYSTGGTQGIGLGAIARMAQVFDAHSDEHGSVILARIYPGRTSKGNDLPFGISHHSMHEGDPNGDTWHLAYENHQFTALVIDGLGHGEEAARAAAAGALRFAEDPFAELSAQMQYMHQGMMGTRGGAVAIAHYDAARSSVRYTGIGNISGSLLTAETSRGLASHPGIVGVQFRSTHIVDHAEASGQLLIMHSDGLQTRWRLGSYPGLWRRHPAVIAALLHRDFCRGRDDVTVLVVALEASHA